MLACDDGLSVVQRVGLRGAFRLRHFCKRRQRRETLPRRRIIRLSRMQQRLGLFLQLFEIGTFGQLTGHTTSMLEACGSQSGSTVVYVRVDRTIESGLGPSREPAGAFQRTGRF